MKIAILSRYQKTISRGGETFAQELARCLSKNHQVDILMGNSADSLSIIIQSGYDIVIPINGRMQSLKASVGRFFGKYKVVIAGQSGIGRDDIWNILITCPNAFVALTDLMESWAKKWAWYSRVVKIPNGVDLAMFKPTGSKYKHELRAPVILSVGALTDTKHHQKTIAALSLIPEASLLIVGDGPLRSELENLATEKLGKRFKIIKANYSDLPAIYRSADVFTLPSWSREAFGIVYIEAMASGLAVVAPDDLARREIVGDAGVLVNVDNSQKFAQAIQDALNKNWGDKPVKQAEKFSWELVGRRYEKLFQELIQK